MCPLQRLQARPTKADTWSMQRSHTQQVALPDTAQSSSCLAIKARTLHGAIVTVLAPPRVEENRQPIKGTYHKALVGDKEEVRLGTTAACQVTLTPYPRLLSL